MLLIIARYSTVACTFCAFAVLGFHACIGPFPDVVKDIYDEINERYGTSVPPPGPPSEQ